MDPGSDQIRGIRIRIQSMTSRSYHETLPLKGSDVSLIRNVLTLQSQYPLCWEDFVISSTLLGFKVAAARGEGTVEEKVHYKVSKMLLLGLPLFRMHSFPMGVQFSVAN
jgi:hypothetical protein